jgi:hypothetical protein
MIARACANGIELAYETFGEPAHVADAGLPDLDAIARGDLATVAYGLDDHGGAEVAQ